MKIKLLLPLLFTTVFFNQPILAEPHVFNEQYANPGDVRQAISFLSELPPACTKSSAYASLDGTVSIRILCESSDKFVDGLVEIRNGIVTKIH
ncbi:hypothetical protein [Methylomagnum ishizawai]|uniref:hypothetical protein n=1 Tax=Methylomagnum ishizawai TaxID=1760988 RepID=UPI001C8194DD|nr:hypothetical protein [Methylomagnum ishizawai]